MKTLLTILAVCLSLAPVAHAEGGHDGNGGGGVLQNGQYMTFYSAGVYVNPIPKDGGTLPSLNALIRLISSSRILNTNSKTRLLNAVLPTEGRNYYDVRADKFGSDVEERLKAEYVRATGASEQQIVLYAVTDTEKRTTYLLPQFYRLTPTGQMAILFHEADWILKPQSTYQTVIGEEVAFQAYAENPNDFASARRFVRMVGGLSDEARFVYTWDVDQGVISNGQVIEGTNSTILSLTNLGISDYLVLNRNSDRLASYAMNLSLSFPHSKFLEFYRDAVTSGRIQVDLKHDDDFCEASGPFMQTGNLLKNVSSAAVIRVDESFSLTASVSGTVRGWFSPHNDCRAGTDKINSTVTIYFQ